MYMSSVIMLYIFGINAGVFFACSLPPLRRLRAPCRGGGASHCRIGVILPPFEGMDDTKLQEGGTMNEALQAPRTAPAFFIEMKKAGKSRLFHTASKGVPRYCILPFYFRTITGCPVPQYLRITPTTLPAIWKSGALRGILRVSYASFSGIIMILSPRVSYRFTVISSPTMNTTISPGSAVC